MEHCVKENELQKIHDELYGNGKPGLHDTVILMDQKLDGILKKQKDSRALIHRYVLTFGGIFFFIVFIGIKDHLKVENFPTDYVSKHYYDQYMSQVNDKVNEVLNAKLTTVKSVLELQEKLANNDTLFNYLKITRSAKTEAKK